MIPFPAEITRDNDLTFLLGPISGMDPTTGLSALYAGASLTGWIASAEESDTALGSVLKTFVQIGTTAKYVWHFEASEVNAALGALSPAATDGQRLYAIAKGAGDLRLAIPLVYRPARIAR